MTARSVESRAGGRAGAILVAVIVTFALVVLAELTMWALLPAPDPYARLKQSLGMGAYVPSAFAPHDTLRLGVEPGLPGMSGGAQFTTNNLGFRGGPLAQPKPAGEVRVFMVGGSSTEGLYLDDTLVTTYLLERRLRVSDGSPSDVRVYNAGKSGDKSFDHVAMLGHRIVHLEPDVVVVFAGINDVLAAAAGRDYLLRETTPVAGSWLWFRLAATEFQLPRHVHRALAGFDPAQRMTSVSLVSDYASKVAVRRDGPAAPSGPRMDLPSYRENLSTLVGIARAHGIRLAFMTQATTWNSEVDSEAEQWHWMTHIDGVTYAEESMDAAMGAYNDVMRDVARQHDVPLLDLASALPKSLQYFYDDVHFNRAGADTAAALLATFLREQDLLRARSTPVAPRLHAARPPLAKTAPGDVP